MADPRQLSKRERQIMDVIYARGEATVAQVTAGIPDPPMRGALRTLLRILEKARARVPAAIAHRIAFLLWFAWLAWTGYAQSRDRGFV